MSVLACFACRILKTSLGGGLFAAAVSGFPARAPPAPSASPRARRRRAVPPPPPPPPEEPPPPRPLVFGTLLAPRASFSASIAAARPRG